MNFIKSNKRYILAVFFPVIYFIIAFIPSGCSQEDAINNSYGEQANITLSVRATSAGINEDEVYWEDRVEELRMIVFVPESGEAIFNQKIEFPNGFADKSQAIQLNPGTYDFYFIANETVYNGDFVSALTSLSNKSDLSTDSRFLNIKYNPDFVPDATTTSGRFLMSAIYNNITITSGGTENNPLPLPLPTTKVELIRALAKVEVVFLKKEANSTIPENTITSVQLSDVASNLSVPPYDGYYTGQKELSDPASLSGFNYANDSIGTVLFYIPEFLVADDGTDYTKLNINDRSYPILSDQSKVGITTQRRTVPVLSDNSVIRNYHYIINVNINAEGGFEIKVEVKPWIKDRYLYLFLDDKQVVIPPVYPTDSSIIIPTDCGKIEILSHNENLYQGLQGAYNDVIDYGTSTIQKGEAPYYCEKLYGEGWRLMNSCELMSFLATLDMAYNVWMCNTWDTYTYNNANPSLALPYYPVSFRRTAQTFLEAITGADLSASTYQDSNNWQDGLSDKN